MKTHIEIIAPGRICLFGDHQDYLELPVIACAINREVQLNAHINTLQEFHIDLPDIKSKRVIPVSETFTTLEAGDHFASSLRVLRRYGCVPNFGFTVTITSTVPINAGTSSSSAIVIAWIYFLLTAFGSDRIITKKLIAQLAYEAEVLEHHAPGGKMDQYAIALGNIIYINTSADFGAVTIGTHLKGLVLAESGIPKQTLGVLGTLRQNAENAIAEITHYRANFHISEVTKEDIDNLIPYVSTVYQPYFYAAVSNHDITQQALKEFQKPKLDYQKIGQLMTQHHMILKEKLGITVPLIDTMIHTALEAGAYGAKIVGSGGGGSIVALTPKSKEHAVIAALQACGAKDAYAVDVTIGARESFSSSKLKK